MSKKINKIKKLNETEKMLLFVKRFFDKSKTKYTITITDGDNVSVNVRE